MSLTVKLPEPDTSVTRAIAVLRRPVPRNCWMTGALAMMWASLKLNLGGFGLLRDVRVLRAAVNFEFRDDCPAKPIVRNHAANGATDNVFGVMGAQRFRREMLFFAGVLRIRHVLFVRLF